MAIYSIAPASKFAVVTASDTDVLTWNGENFATKGVMVAVSGDLACKDEAGNSVTISTVAAGVIHPIQTNQILSTGTTATGITAFF